MHAVVPQAVMWWTEFRFNVGYLRDDVGDRQGFAVLGIPRVQFRPAGGSSKQGRKASFLSSMEIVDAHIHLYPGTEVESLAWCAEGHPLHGQHSVEDYLEATKNLCTVSSRRLRGFIFIETDRKSHLETEAGWDEPLRELDWIRRVAEGRPRAGEGHTSQHAHMCLGVVLWAPLPSGAEAMQRYMDRVQARAGMMLPLVKGFRYLVQDKPPGTMLTASFVDSLRWMGRSGFAFDLGVDARSGGIWQLEEAIEMIERAHDGLPNDKKVTVVISKGMSASQSEDPNRR